MHGVVLAGLRRFVGERYGDAAWDAVLTDAAVGKRAFIPMQAYPDSDAGRIVASIAKLTRVPVAETLEAFGASLAYDLLALYGSLVEPGWDLFDLLENTEPVMHRIVRLRNPDAAPPELLTRRLDDGIAITYVSRRRMCPLARGIVLGLAEHYRTRVAVAEPECMLRGDRRCLIEVRRARAVPAPRTPDA